MFWNQVIKKWKQETEFSICTILSTGKTKPNQVCLCLKVQKENFLGLLLVALVGLGKVTWIRFTATHLYSHIKVQMSLAMSSALEGLKQHDQNVHGQSIFYAPKFAGNDRSVTVSLPRTWNGRNDFSLSSIFLSKKRCHNVSLRYYATFNFWKTHNLFKLIN